MLLRRETVSVAPPRRLRSAALFLAVLLLSLFRWQDQILDPLVKNDETVYVDAIERLLAGESPYADWDFFYPPTFPHLARFAADGIGTLSTLQILRGLTLLGAVVAAWLALAWTGWPLPLRALLALLLVTTTAAVRVGLELGNISAGVAGLLILALFLWPRRPVLAGMALGISLTLKPLGLLLPLFLLVYRGQGKRRARIAALVSVAAAALLLLPWPAELFQYVRHGADYAGHPRNLSLTRVLFCFGLHPPPLLVLAVVAVGAGLSIAFFSGREARSGQGDSSRWLAATSLVATLLALPIAWIYTYVLAFPVLALGAAWMVGRIRQRRRQEEGEGRPVGTALRIVLAGLAILAVLFAHAAGGVETWPMWLQGVVVAVPVGSPLLLLLIMRRKEGR